MNWRGYLLINGQSAAGRTFKTEEKALKHAQQQAFGMAYVKGVVVQVKVEKVK